MKRLDWLLLLLSAILYALPFLLNEYCWWLVFIFPIPLLYVTRTVNLSFVHGYVWGCITFAIHLSGGIYVMIAMAHEWWPVGVALGVMIVLYQALFPACLFWGAAKTIYFTRFLYPFARLTPSSVPSDGDPDWNEVKIGDKKYPRVRLILQQVQDERKKEGVERDCNGFLMARLFVWIIALWLFIIWTDWYSMWIFGIQEGYPLMHPLIPLAQKPALLGLLPIIGKALLTGVFLLLPASVVLLLWYKNYKAGLFFCSAIVPWLLCLWLGQAEREIPFWQNQIKSLPYMAYSVAKNPMVVVKVVGNQLKKIITQYPETDIIIMPESAFNVSNFANLPELIECWGAERLGKKIHVVFGASRWHNGNYYNSLHWVYNGVLQNCCDKRHAMLLSERLPLWMNNALMYQVYFSQAPVVEISSCERIKLFLSEGVDFIPYICSELFCNESPDDIYRDTPIMVLVNDSFFISSVCSLYIQQLLVLLARSKAIQWQRDIVYVSYAQSLFIDKFGGLRNINE
jgi:hypothetical protein